MNKLRVMHTPMPPVKMLPPWGGWMGQTGAPKDEVRASQKMFRCRFDHVIMGYKGVFEINVTDSNTGLGEYEAHVYQCPSCGMLKENKITYRKRRKKKGAK